MTKPRRIDPAGIIAPPASRYMWVMKWRSVGGLDGTYVRLQQPWTQHQTKRECMAYIKEHYGYIAKRRDLRVFPHGWRVPKAVRVRVTVEEA